MSKEFKAIYRILKILMKWQGNEAFANELISAKSVGLSFEKWEQIMIELSNNGYIYGAVYTQNHPQTKIAEKADRMRRRAFRGNEI